MGTCGRRGFMASGIALITLPAAAQGPAHHGGLYESLREPGRTGLPEAAARQRVFDSPAPAAEQPGRWIERAPLPLPRSEMAWAAERDGRFHLLGGYAEQRVDRPYHHVYDPASDTWLAAPPLPLGANHVGVAVLGGTLFAIGGFTAQNNTPHDRCFALERGTQAWRSIAPLPRPTGAIACVAEGGRLHAVGGGIGTGFEARRSVDWHLAYDPAADRWETRAPLPTGRDHTGIVALDGRIHVIGGRVDSFHTNSNLHHAYDPAADRWEMRAPFPTARSGHGAVLYRGRIFCMGGEGSNRVFGQNEAYDPRTDSWQHFAPMPTPRHGLGAVVLGDFIHVAGGGPVMGGGVQSAVHEAFTLG
ncbi:Kelch repeat-containing protein [Arenibaculum pallidiluteum]|uniref:Kelch repeat-containing protein n=1 Tax=Arenibaculum pallidiluteum TaxID=2812559 RepID=UPI001F378AA2|nr:galactose oxidase [Arenibaculum pallidiluteum]